MDLKLIDQFVHLVEQRDKVALTEDSIRLFMPLYQESASDWEDATDECFIQSYYEFRSEGLNVTQTAHMLGKSAEYIEKLLSGEGLKTDTLYKLALAELRANASFAQTHLGYISQQASAGAWKASATLLEKILPEDYAPDKHAQTPAAIYIVDSRTLTPENEEEEEEAHNA